MNSKAYVILLLSFWVNIKKIGAAEEFHVVSTTQNPSGDFLLKQYKHRIEILEFQNFKLQKNLVEQETKLEVLSKVQKKLEEQETKLQDLTNLQKKLEETNFQDLSKLHKIIEQQQTKLQDLSKLPEKLEVQETKLQDLLKLNETIVQQETKLQDLSKLPEKLEEQETKLQDLSKLNETIVQQEAKLQDLSKCQEKLEEQETKLQDLLKLNETIVQQETKLQDHHKSIEHQETKLQDVSTLQKKLEEQGAILQDLHKTIEEQERKLQQKYEQEINLQDLVKLQEKMEGQETKLMKFHDTKSEAPNSRIALPEDCTDAQRKGSTVSGIYKILPRGAPQPFEVLCDMDSRGGGWTHALKRYDGSQDFDLEFSDYIRGFGNLSGEFWIGLDHLHQLTGHADCELLIELDDWEGRAMHAHYKKFRLGGAEEDYPLKVMSEHSGSTGNSLHSHVGVKFSTRNHNAITDCGEYLGAWWDIDGCFRSQLFGRYYHREEDVVRGTGIHWWGFHDYDYSLKTAKMLVRC